MSIIYNWSDEDFVNKWAGETYKIKAGEVARDVLISVDGGSKVLIEIGVALQFAKHLAHREMRKEKIQPGMVNVIEEYIGKALRVPDVAPPLKKHPIEAVAPLEKLETTIEEVPATPAPKKRGRPKKVAE